MSKKTKLVLGAIILFVGIGSLVIGLALKNERAIAGLSVKAIDIFGAKVGTTTTGTSLTLLASMGTTSKSVYIGDDIDTAIYTMKAVTSSTTGSYFEWAILGSNDDSCDTATSSTIYNIVTVSQINWFDVDSTNTRASGRVTNAAGASATGTVVTLKDLNWKCLRMELLGTSTTIWSQLKTKQR